VRRKGHPQSIVADLHEVMRRVGRGSRAVPMEIHPAWRSTVGEAIARATRPESLHQGVLTVVAKNSVWVNELMMLEERIRQGLEGALGERLVVQLRFRVGRVVPRGGRDARSSAPPPPPRELVPELKKKLEVVRDPDLRAAIERALRNCSG
jgi:predicted nucleic acid-binding Zn ribbon protein